AQRLAGDEAGVVAGEVADGRGDIGRSAQAAHGLQLLHALVDLVGEAGRHVGLDEAGGDDVGRHALAAEFAGKGLGETDEAGLGGGVVGLAGVAHHAGGAADVDDAAEAALHHGPGGSAAGDEGALEVHADDLVELLIAHAHQQVVAGDAGVVDEDVEPAVLGGDLFDRRAEGGAVADINGRDTRGSSCGLDGGLEVVERGFGAADEHHVAAIRGETLGDAAADAAAGSGDDGD